MLALIVLWSWALWDALASAGGWMLPVRVAGGATIVLLLVMTTLSSMTIRVKEGEIEWWFGAGWPRGRVLLDRLVDASATRGPVWQGWGIHLTAAGWRWNVPALNAVRLRTTGSHLVLIGTDRPQDLLDAIARARWTGAA
ncbi:MAG: hypothetical protein ACYC8W_12075 [Candidatus Tyrphobacter sp.]